MPSLEVPGPHTSVRTGKQPGVSRHSFTQRFSLAARMHKASSWGSLRRRARSEQRRMLAAHDRLLATSARPPANLLRLRNVPILSALRLEEALFRADSRSWLITNEWDGGSRGAEARGVNTLTGEAMPVESASAIVLGISGKAAELVDLDRARAASVPLCRRFSGGGTVIVDTNTIFVTFLVAEGALPAVAPYPEPILRWTSAVYADAFETCGVYDACPIATQQRSAWEKAVEFFADPLGSFAGRLSRALAGAALPHTQTTIASATASLVAMRSPSPAVAGSITRLCCGTIRLRAWSCCACPRSAPSTAPIGHMPTSYVGSQPLASKTEAR